MTGLVAVLCLLRRTLSILVLATEMESFEPNLCCPCYLSYLRLGRLACDKASWQPLLVSSSLEMAMVFVMLLNVYVTQALICNRNKVIESLKSKQVSQ